MTSALPEALFLPQGEMPPTTEKNKTKQKGEADMERES